MYPTSVFGILGRRWKDKTFWIAYNKHLPSLISAFRNNSFLRITSLPLLSLLHHSVTITIFVTKKLEYPTHQSQISHYIKSYCTVLRSTDICVVVSFCPSEICYQRLRPTPSVLTFWMRLKLHQLGLHVCRNKINIRNNGWFGAACWGALLKLCVKIKPNLIKNINIKITTFPPFDVA
jgi:hypothetical protein